MTASNLEGITGFLHIADMNITGDKLILYHYAGLS